MFNVYNYRFYEMISYCLNVSLNQGFMLNYFWQVYFIKLSLTKSFDLTFQMFYHLLGTDYAFSSAELTIVRPIGLYYC